MVLPAFDTFATLARQGNFVPVYREWVADLETPVSAWYKWCAGQPYSFLLESVEGGEQLGRYSFLGCDPMWVLETRADRTLRRDRDGRTAEIAGNPFEIVPACLADIRPVKLPQLPPGIGGLFGFWGYELIRWIEPRVPVHPPQAGDLPDGLWMQIDRIVVFDRVRQKIWAIAYADLRDPGVDLQMAYERTSIIVDGLAQKLQAPLPETAAPLSWADSSPDAAPVPQSNIGRDRYCASVAKAKEYIRAGDIFQVVLSQRLQAPYAGDPFDLYRSLRAINPSPYMAFFNFGDWQLVGSSPEVMVKATRDETGTLRASLRPIAGTRPRGKTAAADAALAEDLLQDPKEIAEHVMLVDLGRNDLGRVCRQGSVRVDECMIVERYSHVMHIVSNIVGELAAGRTAWDLLEATFPAGTVSGAPKIRAMEIVRELEPERRGPYSGAYGYYDFEGQLNSAITIRTMIVRPQAGAVGGSGERIVLVQAGAGLVADSDPEREYEETLNKARGLLEALFRLQQGGCQ